MLNSSSKAGGWYGAALWFSSRSLGMIVSQLGTSVPAVYRRWHCLIRALLVLLVQILITVLHILQHREYQPPIFPRHPPDLNH